MKKKVISVLSAALLGASLIASGVSYAANDQGKVTATTTANLNYRAAQSTSAKIYDVIPKGTTIPVISMTDKWLKVDYDGVQGYVYRSYTQVNDQSAPAASSSKADQIIAYGKQFMGVPYIWGGSTPSGFDCSGFVHYIYANSGVTVTRQSKLSAERDGYQVSYDQLQPGDLVYFYSPVHHIGVYIGNGQMLHTAGAGGVKISSILPGTSYYKNFNTAKRVL